MSDYTRESHLFAPLSAVSASANVTREPQEHEVKRGAHLQTLKAPLSHVLKARHFPWCFEATT